MRFTQICINFAHIFSSNAAARRHFSKFSDVLRNTKDKQIQQRLLSLNQSDQIMCYFDYGLYSDLIGR